MTRAERDKLRALCRRVAKRHGYVRVAFAALYERRDVSERIQRALTDAGVLLAAAPLLVPDLLDRIDELEAENERLRGGA